MLAQLAARTVSGKTPPLPFRIGLWVLVVIFLGAAVFGAWTWWRMRKEAQAMPKGQAQQGRSAQAGCMMIGAIPALLVGLFLLDWAIQVS